MGSRCGVPAKLGVIAFPRQEESVTNQMRREIYAQHKVGVIAFPRQEESVTNQMRREIYAQHKCDEHLQAEKPNQSESTKTPYEQCGQRRQLDDHGSHRRKLAQPRRLRQKTAEPSRRGVREKLSQPDGAHVRGGHPGQSAIPELGPARSEERRKEKRLRQAHGPPISRRDFSPRFSTPAQGPVDRQRIGTARQRQDTEE